MPLTQLQQDLQGYAENKLFYLIKDSLQAFKIAGREGDLMPCLCAMFLKAAALIAANSGHSKEDFLRAAQAVYDHEDLSHMKGD
jgi:hypothetical protein